MTDPHIEELNLGSPTEPRQAASVVLLRSGGRHDSDGVEVLLGRRTPDARFMADVWVFPGGAVDAQDGDELAHRMTALRELNEEVGVELTDPGELVPFSRWITPVEVKVRFDTHFFLAVAPAHCRPTPDASEIVDTLWISPAEALEREGKGELLLVFPTIRQLERLARFENVEQALGDARSQPVDPILPRVVEIEGEQRIVLPWDEGYPED